MVQIRGRYIAGQPVTEAELRGNPLAGEALEILNVIKRRSTLQHDASIIDSE